MTSNATHATNTLTDGDIATPTRQLDTGEAFLGLPNHLVVQHILRSEYFDDPADLARLRAVSRGMSDAVAAKGLELEELTEQRAALEPGCFSAVQRLQR